MNNPRSTAGAAEAEEAAVAAGAEHTAAALRGG
jgi:hypothetical protein